MVPAIGAFLWPPSTGLLRAKRYLLTGDTFDAEEAERIGIVTEVVDTGCALARATVYARRLASLRPDTVQATKRTLNQWLRLGVGTVYDPGIALEWMLYPRHEGGVA